MDTNNMNQNENQGYQQYNAAPGGAPVQPQYTGPVTVNNYQTPADDMSVGNWILTIFLSGIPVVGLVMLIIWAVSSSPEKRSRKNWAIAQFVWVLIVVVLLVILTLLGGGLAALGSYNY